MPTPAQPSPPISHAVPEPSQLGAFISTCLSRTAMLTSTPTDLDEHAPDLDAAIPPTMLLEQHPPTCHMPQPTANGSYLHMPLSILSSVLRKQPESPAPAIPDSATEPTSPVKTDRDLPTTSPSHSRPASSSSTASNEEKPKKRAPRPKTTFKLAQPPPGFQKLHIRPKVLLQLHQVVATRRPKPVYEVIPYSILAPLSTRRLARTFRSREKLGAHDLLIVKAEEYGNNDEARSDDERWGSRDVMAVICPGKEEKGHVSKSELLMENGVSWEVTITPSGGYEFAHMDSHGLLLKSRWVPKPSVTRRQSGQSSATVSDDRKFTFSTISANSRRHPIIATMTRDRIDILDSYMMPSATSPPTPNHTSSAAQTPNITPILENETFLDIAKENLPVTTDDALRRFIVASGIWVAFCENWSPAYSLSKNACTPPLPTAMTFKPAQSHRSVSMTVVETPRSASPASTVDENKRTLPKFLRSGTQRLHRNASFSNSPIVEVPPSPSTKKVRSRRSNSTGHADLRGPNKRLSLGIEAEVFHETDEERQSRRSAELHNLKNLSSPSTANSSPVQRPSESPNLQRNSSVTSSDSKDQAMRSVYNPVTTKGLWDSGVDDNKKGHKERAANKIVVQEKKLKEKLRERRSRSKEKPQKEKTSRRRSDGIKQLFSGIFRKEKIAAQ